MKCPEKVNYSYPTVAFIDSMVTYTGLEKTYTEDPNAADLAHELLLCPEAGVQHWLGHRHPRGVCSRKTWVIIF